MSSALSYRRPWATRRSPWMPRTIPPVAVVGFEVTILGIRKALSFRCLRVRRHRMFLPRPGCLQLPPWCGQTLFAVGRSRRSLVVPTVPPSLLRGKVDCPVPVPVEGRPGWANRSRGAFFRVPAEGLQWPSESTPSHGERLANADWNLPSCCLRCSCTASAVPQLGSAPVSWRRDTEAARECPTSQTLACTHATLGRLLWVPVQLPQPRMFHARSRRPFLCLGKNAGLFGAKVTVAGGNGADPLGWRRTSEPTSRWPSDFYVATMSC